jgi:NADPH:quinone reductase-like Zn-dependent oxidoreductase
MKAVFFEQHGEIDVLKYADLPEPTLNVGEVLVKVKAVALNHLDIWVRRGWKGLNLEMPHITGSDIAGEIVKANTPHSQWSPGTPVMINPGVITAEDEWTRSGEASVSPHYKILGEQLRGGMAEYVCVPAANVFKIPEGIKYEEACAPLLVGTTVWRMLFKQANLRAGHSVLVVGAGGGVNSLAIQICKAAGATVYALAGTKEKAKKAAELGATEVINYAEKTNWAAELLKLTKGRGVDIVIDNVGARTMGQSTRAVARGGTIVTVGATSGYELALDARLFFTKQIKLVGSTMGNGQDFINALEFMFRNGIKPVIDQIAPLKDGIKMLKHLEEGKQFGKIVLVP